MDDHNGDKDEFLPDLGNEKDIDCLVFESKVKRANVEFMKSMNDIIQWHISPVGRKKYPDASRTNKFRYRLKAKKYEYDEKRGILYKYSTGIDGIGMYVPAKIFRLSIKNFNQSISIHFMTNRFVLVS